VRNPTPYTGKANQKSNREGRHPRQHMTTTSCTTKKQDLKEMLKELGRKYLLEEFWKTSHFAMQQISIANPCQHFHPKTIMQTTHPIEHTSAITKANNRTTNTQQPMQRWKMAKWRDAEMEGMNHLHLHR
jgi:hypothetical protein